MAATIPMSVMQMLPWLQQALTSGGAATALPAAASTTAPAAAAAAPVVMGNVGPQVPTDPGAFAAFGRQAPGTGGLFNDPMQVLQMANILGAFGSAISPQGSVGDRLGQATQGMSGNILNTQMLLQALQGANRGTPVQTQPGPSQGNGGLAVNPTGGADLMSLVGISPQTVIQASQLANQQAMLPLEMASTQAATDLAQAQAEHMRTAPDREQLNFFRDLVQLGLQHNLAMQRQTADIEARQQLQAKEFELRSQLARLEAQLSPRLITGEEGFFNVDPSGRATQITTPEGQPIRPILQSEGGGGGGPDLVNSKRAMDIAVELFLPIAQENAKASAPNLSGDPKIQALLGSQGEDIKPSDVMRYLTPEQRTMLIGIAQGLQTGTLTLEQAMSQVSSIASTSAAQDPMAELIRGLAGK